MPLHWVIKPVLKDTGSRILIRQNSLPRLRMAKADGSYLKEISRLERQHLLVLDDFGLQTLDGPNRLALLEIIEDRHGKGSVLITSQVPVSGWYEIIGEKTVADAIMDRLVHDAHRIELMGDSMRKTRKRNQESPVEILRLEILVEKR